jgi:diguanylate cyclase (GGDEF)-like protein
MEVTQDILLPVLLAAILANTVLLVLVVVAIRPGRNGTRARAGGEHAFEGSLLSNSFIDHSARSTWRPDEPVADATPASDATARAADDEVEGSPGAEAAEGAATAPLDDEPEETSGVDGLTGLLDQPAFLRLIVTEDARVQRYPRPATVVVVELDGLDRLTERLGPAAADRIVPALADTLRRLARRPDQVARLAPGRFAILLPETDEIAAINYVERVRRACELWLESGAIALRLAAGWASTTGDPSLADAMRLATERMYVELRRQARRADEGLADR